MKAKIFFADEKVRDTFAELKDSRRTEDQSLVALLDRAFDALSQNAFCGVQIPKKQIPKTYRRPLRRFASRLTGISPPPFVRVLMQEDARPALAPARTVPAPPGPAAAHPPQRHACGVQSVVSRRPDPRRTHKRYIKFR